MDYIFQRDYEYRDVVELSIAIEAIAESDYPEELKRKYARKVLRSADIRRVQEITQTVFQYQNHPNFEKEFLDAIRESKFLFPSIDVETLDPIIGRVVETLDSNIEYHDRHYYSAIVCVQAFRAFMDLDLDPLNYLQQRAIQNRAYEYEWIASLSETMEQQRNYKDGEAVEKGVRLSRFLRAIDFPIPAELQF